MRPLASFFADRSGVAAVEMALVLPLLIPLMFGTFEMGNLLWTEHIVVKAVRDGARFAGRQSFTTFTNADGTCKGALDSAALSAIREVTRTGAVSGGATRIRQWTDSAATVTVRVSCDGATTTGIYAGRSSGAPRVTVSASVPYPSLFGALGFATSDFRLNASAQSAVMGI